MKKKRRNILIGMVLLIGFGFFVYYGLDFKPFAAGLGPDGFMPDSEDLVYQNYSLYNGETTCEMNFCDKLYNVDTTIKVENGKIIRTFDGRPELPLRISCSSSKNPCDKNGLPSGFAHWALAKAGYCSYAMKPIYGNAIYCEGGYLELLLSDCGSLGYIDPEPYNYQPDYKCDAYCNPNKAVCVQRPDGTFESQFCVQDGSRITKLICPGTCDASTGFCEGGVTPSEREWYPDASLTGSYIFGQDAKVNVDLHIPQQVLVTGQIIQNSRVVSEASGYTDSSGKITLSFNNPQLTGSADIKVSTTIDGETKDKILKVNFQDIPISLSATNIQTYKYGDDLSINVNVKVSNKNQGNQLVTGRIIKDGNKIKESTGYTNSQGIVTLNFVDVRVEGNAILQLETVYNTRKKTQDVSIFFSTIPLSIQIPSTTDDYVYGSDIEIPIKLIYDGKGYPSTTVYGKIKKSGTLVSETLGFTDSNGDATLLFKTVNALDFNDLEVSATVKGATKSATSKMYFVDVPPILIIIGQPTSFYTYGADISIPVTVRLGNDLQDGTSINAKIVSRGSPIKSNAFITDSKGVATIEFANVNLIGDAQLVVSTTIRGKTQEASTNIFFEGIPITISPSTASPIQYNLEPIEYIVNIEDTFGRDITPGQISNLQASATISDGIIKSNNINYVGSGDYKVVSEIEGNGIYNGVISFNYQGTPFSSSGINIEIRDVVLSVDTSNIEPVADLDSNKTFSIAISSNLGEFVDPDNIIIEVTHPSGIEKDFITFEEMTRVGEGLYEFDYSNFNEVEKYSFDFLVEKEGYTKGANKAVVSVSGGSGGESGPTWISYFSRYKFLIVIGGVGIIGFVLYRKFRRKK